MSEKKKNINQNEIVAPVYRDKILEIIDQGKKSLANRDIVKRKLSAKNTDAEITRGPIAQMKAAGMKISDSMYYMLYPKYVEGLTKKQNHNGAITQSLYNVVTMNASSYNVEKTSNNERAYNALIKFQNSFKSANLPNDRTITSFDWETFGGGANEYGMHEILGIYDYSFQTIDHKGNSVTRSSLIGWTENNDIHKTSEKIIKKLQNGERLSQFESVAYDFMSRFGASIEHLVNHNNGRYTLTTLTDAAESEYKTLENFKKGVGTLRKIGDEQQKIFGDLGGYRALIDDISDIVYGGDNVFIGFNNNAFDNPVIRKIINSNSKLKHYFLDRVGESVDTTFSNNNTLDLFDMILKLPQSKRDEFLADTQFDENGHIIPLNGKGPLQLETLFNRIVGDVGDIHHNTSVDTTQNFGLIGFTKGEDDKWNFNPKNNPFLNIVLNRNNQSFVGDGAIQEMTDEFTILPKTLGGINYSMTANNYFGVFENNGAVYFSDGMTASVDANGKLIDFKTQNGYNPSMWNNRTPYTVTKDGLTYLERTSETEDIFKRLEKQGYSFNGVDRIVKISMSPYTDSAPKNRKNRSITTLYVPQAEFESFFNKNFDVIELGGEETEAANRYKNEVLYYRQDSKVVYSLKNDIKITTALKNRSKEIINENATRKIEEGSLDTIYKATLIRDIADKGLNGDVGELQSIISDYLEGKNEAEAKLQSVLTKASGQMTDEEKKLANKFKNKAKGSFDKASTWKTMWTRKDTLGFVNGGWMDNTFAIADNMKSGSLFYNLTKSLNGANDSNTRMIFIESLNSLRKIMDSNGTIPKEKVFGITKAFKREDNKFIFNTGTFFKRYGVKGSSYPNNTIELSVVNSKQALKALFSKIGRSAEHMSDSEQSNLLTEFIISTVKAGTFVEDLDRKKIEKDIRKLITSTDWNNNSLSVDEKMSLFQHMIRGHFPISPTKANYRYGNKTYSVSASILNSILMEESSEQYSFHIPGVIEEARNNVKNENEFLQRFALNGRTQKESIEDYARSLKEAGFEEGSKEYKEMMGMFKAQIKSHSDFINTFTKAVRETNGSMYFNDKNRLMIKYNGAAVDVTNYIPRFSYHNGATYTTMGARSYSTGFRGHVENGIWKVDTVLDSAKRRIKGSNLDEEIQKAKLLGESEESVVQRWLSRLSENVREKDIMSTNPFRDLINNRNMSYSDIYIGAGKQDLLNYLNSDQVEQTKEIKEFITALEKYDDKAGGYIGGDLRNGFQYLMENGILANKTYLSDGEDKISLQLTASVKENTAVNRVLSLGTPVEYDVSSLNSEIRGSKYVEAGTVNFLRKDLEDNGLLSEFDEIKTRYDKLAEGKGIASLTNKLKVNVLEFNTALRDEAIEAFDNADGSISSELMKKLTTFVNPAGGGAYIAGSVLDKSGYIDGIRRFNLEAKSDILNDDQINKSRATIKVEANGEITTKYRGGFIAAKDSPILEYFSNFNGKNEESARKASSVREEFYLKDSNTLLSKSRVGDYIKETLENEGLDVTQENVDKIAKRDLRAALVATPLYHSAQAKTKEILGEKHEAVIGLETLSDIKDKRLEELIMSKEWQQINKDTHTKMENAILRKDIFDDIANGEFSSVLFDSLDKDQKKALKDIIDKQDDNGETLGSLLSRSRYRLENAVNQVFGGGQKIEYIADSTADAWKHSEVGKHILASYALTKKHDEAFGAGIEEINDKFKDILFGEGIKYTDEGIEITDPSKIAIDVNKFINKSKAGEIETTGIGKGYEGYIQIAPVPNEQAKKPILADLRVKGRLFGKVWDKEEVARASENMLKAGYSQNEIDQLFGGDKPWGAAIWDTEEFRQSIEPTFIEGETLANPKYLNVRKTKLYNDIKKQNLKTPISKEFLDDIILKQDVDASTRINNALQSGDKSEEVARLMREYNFEEIKPEDANWNFNNSKKAYKLSKNAFWDKNVVLDLEDASIGLDKSFFGDMSSKMAIPSAPVMAKGDSLSFNEYQKSTSRVLRGIDRLKDLNKTLQTKDLSDSERKVVTDTIERTKGRIMDDLIEIPTKLKEFNSMVKKTGLLSDRMKARQSLASRSTSQVFDTSTWFFDKDEKIATAYDTFTYKGKRLRDIYKQGDQISFGVASTKDLEKYGFTDKYFTKLGIDKKEWLENARTEGIAAIVTRNPGDYAGSTRAIQLYFSDDVNAGFIQTDITTAELMKQDSDGDNIATFVVGSRDKKGRYVDITSSQIAHKNLKVADSLQTTHDTAMALDAYSTLQRNPWKDFNKSKIGIEAYNKKMGSKISDVISNTINGVVYANDILFKDRKTINQYKAEWEQAQSLIKKANLEEQDLYSAGNIVLENSQNYNFSDEEIETIRKGMLSRNRTFEAATAFYAKQLRGGTGEMDTPFDTIDQLSQLYRSKEYAVIRPDATFTQRDFDDIFYIHESSKEGFLTAKKTEAEAISMERKQIAKKFQNYLGTAISNTGEKQETAFKNIAQLLIENGKSVIDRNTEYEPLTHEERVYRGIEVLRKMINNLRPEVRSQMGMHDLRNTLISSHINQMTKGVIFGEDTSKSREFFIENGMKDLYEASMENARNVKKQIDDANKLTENMKRLKKLDVSGDTAKIKSLIKKRSGGGWSKNIVGLAGAIMFTGFVGGNPATPSGQEAIEINQQKQQQYMSPIPPQSQGSLNNMRQGPNQGYIININARANRNYNDTYLSNVISNAVQNNYNNTQVNINYNTQQQTDITYNQVYSYMQQSLI